MKERGNSQPFVPPGAISRPNFLLQVQNPFQIFFLTEVTSFCFLDISNPGYRNFIQKKKERNLIHLAALPAANQRSLN